MENYKTTTSTKKGDLITIYSPVTNKKMKRRAFGDPYYFEPFKQINVEFKSGWAFWNAIWNSELKRWESWEF